MTIMICCQVCFEYMDKQASDIIKHESFLQLSPTALSELISRDSFYVPEIDIFLAMQLWIKANPEVDNRKVIGNFYMEIVIFLVE